MRGASFSIDRDRFMLLVSALASSGCSNPAAEANVPRTVTTVDVPPPAPWDWRHASSPPTVVPPPPPAPAQEPAAAIDACVQENDTGTVDCSHMAALRLGGPACEGAQNTCELLAKGASYRPHAAHIRPQYTKEECVKAVSALDGGDREWAIGAMGPSSEGKCQLMFTVF